MKLHKSLFILVFITFSITYSHALIINFINAQQKVCDNSVVDLFCFDSQNQPTIKIADSISNKSKIEIENGRYLVQVFIYDPGTKYYSDHYKDVISHILYLENDEILIIDIKKRQISYEKK